jgi:DNA-binding CsgD family transcriptional regulator
MTAKAIHEPPPRASQHHPLTLWVQPKRPATTVSECAKFARSDNEKSIQSGGETDMLQRSFQAVLEVKNREEFRGEIVRFAHHLGFSKVSAMSVFDRPTGRPEFVAVDNMPADFREKLESVERHVRDPVGQHCKRSSRPIIWNQATYVAAGLGEYWEEQALFGYRSGIGVALHLPEGRHFVLGVDLDGALPKNPDKLSRMVADLQLFTVYAQEAAGRVLLPAPRDAEKPVLTPREVEALRWTFEGKTAWEVGKILGIAERTAVFHVNNAMHKLGCITKHQAAIRAERMGILR